MSPNSEPSQCTNIQSCVELFCRALDISEQKDYKLRLLASLLDFDVGRHGIYYELKNGPGRFEIDLAFYFPNTVPAKQFFARLALPFTRNIFGTTAEFFCKLSAWRHKTKSSGHWLIPKISNIFVI